MTNQFTLFEYPLKDDSQCPASVWKAVSIPDGEILIVKIYKKEFAHQADHEFNLKMRAYKAGIPTVCPLYVIDYEKGTRAVVMPFRERIMSLADFIGEDKSSWKKIKKTYKEAVIDILQSLYRISINYVDRTAYNFMIDEDSGEILVLDFGDAIDEMVEEDDRKYEWNKEFI